LFQFLSTKKRLDLLLLLEDASFSTVYKKYVWVPHSKLETRVAAEKDVEFYSGVIEYEDGEKVLKHSYTFII
jgi:hypothetical protein